MNNNIWDEIAKAINACYLDYMMGLPQPEVARVQLLVKQLKSRIEVLQKDYWVVDHILNMEVEDEQTKTD